MKSFKQFLKEEIDKAERQAQNIVGAKEAQMKEEACESRASNSRKKNKSIKKKFDEDAEDMNSTPSATPTGEVSAEVSASGAPINQEENKEDDKNNAAIQQVLDILDQRGKDLDQESQQEYLVRKQRFDELMKQINDVIGAQQ